MTKTARKLALVLSLICSSAGALFVSSGAAQANYVFVGTGISGNFIGQAGEPFQWNTDLLGRATSWGSPGVGPYPFDSTPYLEAQTAYGFVIILDIPSIAVSSVLFTNRTSGGTWRPFFFGSPNDFIIEFLAQKPSDGLTLQVQVRSKSVSPRSSSTCTVNVGT
jgi:hypothetical protein